MPIFRNQKIVHLSVTRVYFLSKTYWKMFLKLLFTKLYMSWNISRQEALFHRHLAELNGFFNQHDNDRFSEKQRIGNFCYCWINQKIVVSTKVHPQKILTELKIQMMAVSWRDLERLGIRGAGASVGHIARAVCASST